MTELFKAIVDFLGQFKLLVIVLKWEVAVRTRLGKHVALLQPGWHLKLPFVDDVQVVNTRLRVTHTQPQTVTSEDGKTVTLSFVVGFSIVKPLETLMKLIQPELTLSAIVQSATAQHVWNRRADELTMANIEDAARRALFTEIGSAVRIDWVRVADFMVTRTYRLVTSYAYDRQGTATEERKI